MCMIAAIKNVLNVEAYFGRKERQLCPFLVFCNLSKITEWICFKFSDKVQNLVLQIFWNFFAIQEMARGWILDLPKAP